MMWSPRQKRCAIKTDSGQVIIKDQDQQYMTNFVIKMEDWLLLQTNYIYRCPRPWMGRDLPRNQGTVEARTIAL